MPGKRPISVGRAIAFGLLWVNGPIFPIMFGVPFLLFYGWMKLEGGLRFPGFANITLVLVILSSGFVLAWLWWSVTVPKWRVVGV